MVKYTKELAAARDAAMRAGAIQMKRRRRTIIDCKADRSPVTDVDNQCEALIRDTLARLYPADGFLGEETGSSEGTSGRTWIVDPLDGTRPYIRGIPTHSVLIALEEGGRPVVGVMHLPGLGETYWARDGGGAFLNGKPVRVSTTRELSRAMGSALGFLEKSATAEAAATLDCMKRCEYMYGFMDAYSYGGVAAGRLDVCVNLLDKPWDCAAAACIVREAGGRFSDINGNECIRNGSIVFTNGILHDAVLAFFGRAAVRRRKK